MRGAGCGGGGGGGGASLGLPIAAATKGENKGTRMPIIVAILTRKTIRIRLGDRLVMRSLLVTIYRSLKMFT